MASDPYIETRSAWVEFPIFDAKTRSLKKAFLGKAGGAIGRNTDNVVVIDWNAIVTDNREFILVDGIHVSKPAGMSAYMELVEAALVAEQAGIIERLPAGVGG